MIVIVIKGWVLLPQNKCPQLVWTGKLAVCRQTGQSQSWPGEAHDFVGSWRGERRKRKTVIIIMIVSIAPCGINIRCQPLISLLKNYSLIIKGQQQQQQQNVLQCQRDDQSILTLWQLVQVNADWLVEHGSDVDGTGWPDGTSARWRSSL